VITEGWPEATTAAVLKDAFPTAMAVALRMDGGEFTGHAAVYFVTADAAKVAAETKGTVGDNGIQSKWAGVISSFFGPIVFVQS